MSNRVIGIVLCVAAVMVVAALGIVSFELLVESYGDGPPYYGRTTNMDKWSSPLPWLMVIAAVGLTLAGLLAWLGLRRLRR